ncbi:MAG: phosphodiester glycosidase family protein [Candidatus Sericytochromatia bacterium]|nr:phosphodiester glycosidase family protein [Candidatus Tanganyikabacteria bacterium]
MPRLVAFWCAVFLILAGAQPASAAMIRVASEGERTQIRVLATRPRALRSSPVAGGVRWDFRVANPGFGLERRSLARGPVREIEVYHHGLALEITLRWRFPMPHLRPEVSIGSVEFEFEERVSRASSLYLRQGLLFQRVSRFTAAGPVSLHVLRLRLGESQLKLRTASSRDLFKRDTVSHIVRNYQAVAGINGSFFAPATSAPVGLLLTEGKILSSSFYNRSVFGIRHDGTSFISQSRLFAAIAEESGKVYLARAVNKPAQSGLIVLYTSHWGPRTGTVPDPSRREFAIARDGRLLAAATGNMPIPAGGYVMSAQGRAIFEMRRRLRIGATLNVYARLNGTFEGARMAVSGGPTLIQGGAVRVTAREERFGPEIARGRAARTAICSLGGKDIALITVDGRPRNGAAKRKVYGVAAGLPHSVGMTLYELARFMQEIGCRDGINLDGGGSTAMVVGQRVVNVPADGFERPVQNALLVF